MGNLNNLKFESGWFSERKQANKPTAKCVYQWCFLRLWVFQTWVEKYIVGRAWINKQQHCIQCEIKQLKLHHDYPTDLKAPADLMFIVYPKKNKTGNWTNNWECLRAIFPPSLTLRRKANQRAWTNNSTASSAKYENLTKITQLI